MARSKLRKVMQSGEHNESEVRKFKSLSLNVILLSWDDCNESFT